MYLLRLEDFLEHSFQRWRLNRRTPVDYCLPTAAMGVPLGIILQIHEVWKAYNISPGLLQDFVHHGDPTPHDVC